MDLDAIFDGTDPAILPEPQPVEAPAPAVEPVEAEPPEMVTPPEPVTQSKPDPERTAPLTALLDERDKRKAAERRLAELEAAQAQRQPADVPDPYDDPAGYQAHIDAQVEARFLNQKFELSEAMARDKHGDELVATAMEWGADRARTNPAFRDEFLAQKNPIDWVVRQQKRDGLLADVGDDPDAYVRRRAAELGLIAAPDAGAGTMPVPGTPQAPKPAAPPRSIANATSAGGIREAAVLDDAAIFGDVFKG